MYFERAMFIVGQSKSGKSTQLRSSFLDVRFHTDGVIPNSNKLKEIIRLSNERAIYLRLTSPHEAEENPEKFLAKADAAFIKHAGLARRFSFLGPLQPSPFKNMPSAAETVDLFVKKFHPERVRVLVIDPDRHGSSLPSAIALQMLSDFASINVEVCRIDARNRQANGLFISDFFDFT